MDLSEFKPPVRLSMSDEEIYQALGEAQANEDGLARAMAIVEEQANLREHDNQLFAEWVARMRASDAPEAKIALENVERAKQGLEPLPFVAAPVPVAEVPPAIPPVEDVVAALNAAHSQPEPEVLPVIDEVVEEEELPPSIFAELAHDETVETVETVETLEDVVAVESIVEIDFVPEPEPQKSAEEEFEQLLADASDEATTSILVPGTVDEPVVTFDSVPEFAVAADEDALVEEEAHQKVAKQASGWWSNAAFLVLGFGVIAPAVVAYLSATAGFSFGSALFGFAIGSLVNLGLLVSAHFTSRRSTESQVVTSRATFGVFGAAVPGIAATAALVAVTVLTLVGSTATFNGVFAGVPAFGTEIVSGASLSTVINLSLIVVAFAVAGFARRAVRWVNAVVAALLLIAFVVGALVTRDQISFASIDTSINFDHGLIVAALVSVFGVFLYGKAPRVLVGESKKSNTVARWSAVVGFAIVLPMAVFAHFNLIYSQRVPASGFDLLDTFALAQQSQLTSPVFWVIALALITLAINLASASLESLRAFAINNLRSWFGILAGLAIAALVWFVPTWSTWLQVGSLLVAPTAAAVGFAVADSLLRRGNYHEASLLRGYGFYGRFNFFAVGGYVLAVVIGFALSQPNELAPWFGFAGTTTMFAPFASLAFAFIWSVATSIPRIKAQQQEVAEVEQRKASLSAFSGFAE
ncbi:MAG: hypothetical protein RL488_475 [Actinomycetota bacterium]|jgi:hypothetical protein